MMKVTGQKSGMQVNLVLGGGREVRVCLDENSGRAVRVYLCYLGSPKNSWPDAYLELVEQRARVQERCKVAPGRHILEHVQVDAFNVGARRVLGSNILARQHYPNLL
jgi:hypothetical protein